MLRLTRDSAIYALGAVAGKAVAVVLLPILTRALSPDDFGRLEVLSVMASALVSALLLGIDRAALRLYFEREDPERRPLFATWYLLAATLVVPAAVVCVLGAVPISTGLFGSVAYARGVAYTGGVVVFSTLQFVALTILRAQGRPSAYALLSGITLIGYAALTIALIGAVGASVDVVVLAAFVSWAASAVIGLILVRDVALAVPTGPAARLLLAVGLPLAPAVIATWGAEFANRLIVLGLAGPTQVAFLGLGLRAASVAGLAIAGFQLAWEPHAYRLGVSVSGRAKLAADARRALIALAAIVVGLALVAREGLLLVSGEAYLGALPTLGLCLVGALAGGLFVITSTPSALATAMGDIGRASLVGIGVGLVTTVVLTAPFGAAGAACGIAIGQLTMALAVARLGRHRPTLPIPWPQVGAVIAGAGLIALAATTLDASVPLRAVFALAFLALALIIRTDG
jgi:O-antigen/teichoic acid export membrane protein